MSPVNEAIPYYEPGKRITAHAAAAVLGKRFVAIVATRRPGGPAGISDAADGDGNIVVNAPAAGGRVFGVTSHDAAIDTKVTILRGSGFVVPVLAAAPIAFFQEVEVDAQGRVIPLAAGVAVGFAVADAANGTDAQIALY